MSSKREQRSTAIEGPWKKSKRELIERIGALGEPQATRQLHGSVEETGPPPGVPDDAKTVGALVEALVVTELAYGEIDRMVRERFSDARTTARSVASVASVLRKRGITVR